MITLYNLPRKTKSQFFLFLSDFCLFLTLTISISEYICSNLMSRQNQCRLTEHNRYFSFLYGSKHTFSCCCKSYISDYLIVQAIQRCQFKLTKYLKVNITWSLWKMGDESNMASGWSVKWQWNEMKNVFISTGEVRAKALSTTLNL